MAKKAKKPAAKTEKYRPIPGSAVADNAVDGPRVMHVHPEVAKELESQSDVEEMSEAEVEAMANRQEVKKEQAKARIEAEVDSQSWSVADPIIPDELKGRVWIAVYRCPEGHKTKATNRQAESGVFCWRHREAGQNVKAEIMPQFLSRPVTDNPEAAKRDKAKRAAKGAQ